MSKGQNKTRFDGVFQRECPARSFKGKPDLSYIIDYYDAQGARVRRVVGRKSTGMTAVLAASIRADCIADRNPFVEKVNARKKGRHELTIKEGWEMYRRDWLERNTMKVDTFNSYYKKHISGYFGPRVIASITRREVEDFIAMLYGKGLSTGSIYQVVSLLRGIVSKASDWGKFKGENVFRNAPVRPLDNQRTRYLTRDEAQRLLSELAQREDPFWHAASVLSLSCGLRLGEITKLIRSDIDFERGTLYIRNPKNGHSRHAYFTPSVASVLERYRSLLPHESLFPCLRPHKRDSVKLCSHTFARTIEKLGFNKGITDRRQKVVFHTLRHTYASWLAAGGVPLQLIADMLGHRSIQMTQRYAHIMPENRMRTTSVISAALDWHQ